MKKNARDIIVVLMEKKNKIFLLNLFIVTIIFLIDRLCKLYVINLYEDISNQQIFLTSFLNVYLIWNEGIAFGLLSFESLTIYNIITFLILLINILIIYILFKLDDLSSEMNSLEDRLITKMDSIQPNLENSLSLSFHASP